MYLPRVGTGADAAGVGLLGDVVMELKITLAVSSSIMGRVSFIRSD